MQSIKPLVIILMMTITITSFIACDKNASSQEDGIIDPASYTPIFVAILYDASSSAHGIFDINDGEFLTKLLSQIWLNSGSLRINFINGHSDKYSKVELNISPLNYKLPTQPIKANFRSSFKFTKAINEYYEEIKYYKSIIKPQYDSLCKAKIKIFLKEFEIYKKEQLGKKLIDGTQISIAIAKTIPFFQELSSDKKYMILITDGQEQSYSNFKLDTEAFNKLNIQTFVIGLSKTRISGEWQKINYLEISSFQRAISKITYS